MGWSKDPPASFMKAAELAEHALSMNDSLDTTQALMGIIYLSRREFDKALSAVEKAVSLNPSGADVHAWQANVLSACGRHEEAFEATQRAIRLNPLPPAWNYLQSGRICCFLGDYDKALIHLEKAVETMAPSGPLYFNLTVTHSLAGNLDKAKAVAKEMLKWYPEFSLEVIAELMPFKNRDDIELILKAFRRVGLE